MDIKNNFDFREHDKLELKLIKDLDYEKLVKFIKNNHSVDTANYIKNIAPDKNDLKNIEFVVTKDINVKETSKTKTKYMMVSAKMKNGGNFCLPVQLRYVKVKFRKNKHPLTRLFLPDLPGS
jgi:hypothetical protein